MSPRKIAVSLAALGIFGWSAAAIRHGEIESLGVTRVNAATVETTLVRGEPVKKTAADLTVWVPAELAASGNAFDVVVHFHGASANQEQNAAEAGLKAVVVSANEGMGSTPYARAFEKPGSLDRAIDLAIRTVDTSGHFDTSNGPPRVRFVALSSWSAGGAAVKQILDRERDAERVDAILLADGIFSRFTGDPKTKSIETKPLDPFVRFGRRAVSGEKLMMLTHTAIETPQYPNVKECTDVLLDALDLPRSEEAVYSLDRGELHVRGSAGKGPQDHVEQIRALDEGYALLARRWRH
jgi:hypothetical protein